jgi:hypothetical protein
MVTFHIQEYDGEMSSVSHKEFYEILNSDAGYLHYSHGGVHIAMLPTATIAETIHACRQADNAENVAAVIDNRCRDEKGRLCRYQHNANGQIIRNGKGLPVYAKCGDCPRDGWIAGKRENCCLRNYCKVGDCVYCPYPRECHSPHSLEWLTADKLDYGER